MGFFVRKHGLTIDDLLAAEIVTADGELLTLNERSHPDLFWAIRGGGGNFGVVTRLRLRLHEIDHVIGGMLVLPASADVISGLIAAADAAPEELSVIAKVMKAPPLRFIPRKQHGNLVVVARMVYSGDPASGAKAIEPIRKLATPLADLVRAIRYSEMYAGPEPPGPAFSAGTNLLLDELSARSAEAIVTHLENATAAIPVVELRVLGGAMARVADEATAFGHRKAKLMVNISAMSHRVDERAQEEAWSTALANAISGGVTTRAYAGFIGEGGPNDIRRAYPTQTLKRLAEVKRQYEPDNLFHMNLNIAPAMRLR